MENQKKLTGSILAGFCLLLMLSGGCGRTGDMEEAVTGEQGNEKLSETDGWEGKDGYYALEGKQEQDFVNHFLGERAYEQEPYFSYVNPEGATQMKVWYDLEYDRWCGIRYAVTESEKEDGYPYGFVIEGEGAGNREEVTSWNPEPVEEILQADEFIAREAPHPERITNTREDIELDQTGRLLSYKVHGDYPIYDFEEDKEVVHESEYFYSIKYAYYSNGMKEKTYDHNMSHFGTLGHFNCNVYDQMDREVYSKFFGTSAIFVESYYSYEGNSDIPTCELVIDEGRQGVPPRIRFYMPEQGEIDYEQRLEQAAATLEKYFSESHETLFSLEEFQEEINPALPEYMRILDICHGEMGEDKVPHIAVVLEFTEDYPYEIGDDTLAFGQRVLCIFQEAEENGYQCRYRNNRLLLDARSIGTAGDSYKGIQIEDGVLTVSQGTENVFYRGLDYTFGYEGNSLQLLEACKYEEFNASGEGEVEYFNFNTGTATEYSIGDWWEWWHTKKSENFQMDSVKTFITNRLHPIPFEDTVYGELRKLLYTCSVRGTYLLEEMEKQIVLAEDTEIEGYEWVDEEETCLRVRVCYQEAPEQSYQHKEDYFFFLGENRTVVQVLYVDYPSKAEDASYPDYPDRYPMDACDFDAHMEDVTFDGNADLIISLGCAGVHGTPVSCAYVYENGVYRYEPTFEDIPTYEVDAEQKVLRGYARSSANSYTDYIYEYRNGLFVVSGQDTYEQYEDENGVIQEKRVE